MSEFSISCRRFALLGTRTALAVAVAGLLAACGAKSSQTPPTQVAAKVGKSEISVHQINFVLQRQPEVPAPQQAAAQREALERLIDQELALQKAQSLKIDRDPQVMQAVDAARRDIVARAYIDQVAGAVAKPTPEEIKKFHAGNPLLFAQRRIYDLQEVNTKARPEQLAALAPKLNAARSPEEAVSALRSQGLTPDVRQSSLAPENMPQPLVERIAALQPGQALVLNANGGVKVVFVTQSRPAPIDEATALTRIEAYLLSDRKRQAAENDLKALRAAVPVEYTGPFAGATAPAATPAAATAPLPTPATKASAPAVDDATINRGLK